MLDDSQASFPAALRLPGEHREGGGIQALLEAGANPFTPAKDKRRTPLSQARKYGNTAAADVLEAALAHKTQASRR